MTGCCQSTTHAYLAKAMNLQLKHAPLKLTMYVGDSIAAGPAPVADPQIPAQ